MKKIIGSWFFASFFIIAGIQLLKIFSEKFTENFQSGNDTSVLLYGILLKILPFIIYALTAFCTIQIYKAGSAESSHLNKKILILPAIFSGAIAIIPICLNFGIIPFSGAIAVFSAQFAEYTYLFLFLFAAFWAIFAQKDSEKDV